MCVCVCVCEEWNANHQLLNTVKITSHCRCVSTRYFVISVYGGWRSRRPPQSINPTPPPRAITSPPGRTDQLVLFESPGNPHTWHTR